MEAKMRCDGKFLKRSKRASTPDLRSEPRGSPLYWDDEIEYADIDLDRERYLLRWLKGRRPRGKRGD